MAQIMFTSLNRSRRRHPRVDAGKLNQNKRMPAMLPTHPGESRLRNDSAYFCIFFL